MWLTQKALSELFDCTSDNISLHLKNIFKEGELQEKAVTEEFSATAADGKKYSTGRELLTHAGGISHQIAEEISAQQLGNFKQRLKDEERLASLDELE